ncbi:MAG TPA: FAD-linked oxidase C-terminal domain-containing protein [bacterium]|nr:FAD-linked oxidase C-terminal domain-containing protein [bacterium]
MHLPEPLPERLAKRDAVLRALHGVLPRECVLQRPEDLIAYETDGLPAYRQQPLAVVQPRTTQEVAKVMKALHKLEVPVVPWGAGTGLSGGALPLADGVTVAMSRMNRILEIDLDNRCAVVQPGVTNLRITQAVQAQGFYYAPDPSSQIACSIGGNVAENSGGVHCLKYGVTTNNLLGLEVVLADGTIMRVGSRGYDDAGYDLLGVLTGSEGLLGIITEVTVRLLPRAEAARALLAVFDRSEDAGQAVADVIAAGMVPGGMEIMDKLAIEAAEQYAHAGYPVGAEAILLVELDGPASEVEHLIGLTDTILRKAGATEVRVSSSEEERLKFWAGRKAAFPAMGRISPDYYCMDGTIPRSALPRVLARIRELSDQYGLRVANVFHAGDGNLHPLVLYDSNVPGELETAETMGEEILKLCVDVGGVLTGEHGVGVEKRDLMAYQFGENDLDAMQRVKCSFDTELLLNPGKMFPTLHRCAELGRMHVHGGETRFPELERF